MLTKLDSYDYYLLPGVVQIELASTKDPTLVDILSELDKTNGRMYVEGHYYILVGHEVIKAGNKTYLNLQVTNAD